MIAHLFGEAGHGRNGVMAEYIATRNPDMPPMHPGVLVTEIVEGMKRPVAEIADTIGISHQHLDAIMRKKRPVTPEVARLLGKAFGNGPELWIKLQATYDAWTAAH